MSTTSLADAKNRLSELVSSAQKTHERTVITKNGRPVAMLMSIDDWESVEETMFWLPYLDEIRAAQAEPSEIVTHEQMLELIRRRHQPHSGE